MKATLDDVVPPLLGEIFNFRVDRVEAMETLKSGRTVGKVVLENSDNPHQ